MPLSDGDAADGGDVWFRVATQEAHLVRGRVHHSAFKGTAISAPEPDLNRPWALEMSGRLRSLAGDTAKIEADALAYCAKHSGPGGTKTFGGVMYARVDRARSTFEDTLDTNVHFTPLVDDSAHSDLTFSRAMSPEERSRIADWLQDLFEALHSSQVHFLDKV